MHGPIQSYLDSVLSNFLHEKKEKEGVRLILDARRAHQVTHAPSMSLLTAEDPVTRMENASHTKLPSMTLSTWACFEDECTFSPSLRRLGARSVYIHHTVFDRALQSPLKRLFQQRSELFYDNQAQGDEPKESNLDFLL